MQNSETKQESVSNQPVIENVRLIVPKKIVYEEKSKMNFLKSPPLTENKIGEARSTALPEKTKGKYIIGVGQTLSGTAAPLTSLKASVNSTA